MKRFLYITLFLLICGQAWAATYYIDPDCGSPGDGTSYVCSGATAPFDEWSDATISGANSFLQKAGSTATAAYINVAGDGVSTSSRLIIGSYDGATGLPTTEKAIVSGLGNGQNRVINVPERSYVTIQDLEITYNDPTTQDDRMGIAIPSSGGTASTNYDNIIQRCYVHTIINDDSASDFTNGIRAAFNGGLKILNTTVTNISTDGFWGGGNNLEIGYSVFSECGKGSEDTGDEIQIVVGTGLNIHDNTLTHQNADEKQVLIIQQSSGAASGTVSGNTITGYSGAAATHRPVNFAAPVTLRQNYISGCGNSGTIFLGAGAVGSVLHNNIIVVTSDTNAIYANDNDVEIYNNTIYTGVANTLSGVYELGAITGGVITNNIISNFNYGFRSTNTTDSYNDIYNSGTYACAATGGAEAVCGTGTITSDPLFANAAGANFNLKTGSGAINVGTDLGDTYTYDFNGYRNQDHYGSGWEIGALIYPSRKIHRRIAGQGVY